jgi:hypothetical protein
MAAPSRPSEHQRAIGKILAAVEVIFETAPFAGGVIPYDPAGVISRDAFFSAIGEIVTQRNAMARIEQIAPQMKLIADKQAEIALIEEYLNLYDAYEIEKTRHIDAVLVIEAHKAETDRLETQLRRLVGEVEEKNNELVQQNAITVNCLETYRINGDATDRANWIASKIAASDIRVIIQEKKREIDVVNAELTERRMLLAETTESDKIFRGRCVDMCRKLGTALAPGGSVVMAKTNLEAAVQEVAQATRRMNSVPLFAARWDPLYTSVSIVYG